MNANLARAHVKSFPLLMIVLLAFLFKAPILILLSLIVFTIIGVGAVVSIANKPAKKKAVAPPVKKVIPGVGEVDWITDPRQLESQQTWNKQQLRQAENCLLDTPVGVWIADAERVFDAEQEKEAEEAKQPPPSRPKGHNVICHCTECMKAKFQGEPPARPEPAARTYVADHEVHVAERAEPIARYAAGGIVADQGPEWILLPGTIEPWRQRAPMPKSPKNPIPHYRPRQKRLSTVRGSDGRLHLADYMVNRWG